MQPIFTEYAYDYARRMSDIVAGGLPDNLSAENLASLPKVSLHDHLDGGLRLSTVIELSEEAGLSLPANDPDSLAEWVAERSNSGSLVEYLQTFAITAAIMQNRENLVRIAREFVEDLAADGVIWGEIRWAPEQHTAGGLSLDEAVDAVQEGIQQGIIAAYQIGRTIDIGQLITAMRQGDRGLEIAQLALRYRERGAVGFDIAGPEAGFPPSRFTDAFDLLAREFFPVTVHAGEADGLDSIRSALIDGRALRLGHGVRIAEDITLVSQDNDASYLSLGYLADWVKDRGIALEVSPTSNLQTGAIAAWGSELGAHPIDLLYRMGFRVTVNTDNRMMSGTTLSRELALLAQTFDYNLDDLLAFQLNAAEAAFLSLEERADLLQRIQDGFGGGA